MLQIVRSDSTVEHKQLVESHLPTHRIQYFGLTGGAMPTLGLLVLENAEALVTNKRHIYNLC